MLFGWDLAATRFPLNVPDPADQKSGKLIRLWPNPQKSIWPPLLSPDRDDIADIAYSEPEWR
jgi:hypothetical protein